MGFFGGGSGGTSGGGLDPSLFLPRSGGTMLGPLILYTDSPATDREATSRLYVEQQVANRLPLTGGTLTGALSVQGVNGDIEIGNRLIRASYIHPTIPYANYLHSVELVAGPVTGMTDQCSEVVFRSERPWSGSGPAPRRWSLRKDVGNNLILLRYDDAGNPSPMLQFWRYREDHEIQSLGDLHLWQKTFIAHGDNLDGLRVQAVWGGNYWALNNENQHLNIDGFFTPATSRYRMMTLDFRQHTVDINADVGIHSKLTVDGDIDISGQFLHNGTPITGGGGGGGYNADQSPWLSDIWGNDHSLDGVRDITAHGLISVTGGPGDSKTAVVAEYLNEGIFLIPSFVITAGTYFGHPMYSDNWVAAFDGMFLASEGMRFYSGASQGEELRLELYPDNDVVHTHGSSAVDGYIYVGEIDFENMILPQTMMMITPAGFTTYYSNGGTMMETIWFIDMHQDFRIACLPQTGGSGYRTAFQVDRATGDVSIDGSVHITGHLFVNGTQVA